MIQIYQLHVMGVTTLLQTMELSSMRVFMKIFEADSP